MVSKCEKTNIKCTILVGENQRKSTKTEKKMVIGRRGRKKVRKNKKIIGVKTVSEMEN